MILDVWWGLVALAGIAGQLVESLFRKKGPPCPKCGAPL